MCIEHNFLLDFLCRIEYAVVQLDDLSYYHFILRLYPLNFNLVFRLSSRILMPFLFSNIPPQFEKYLTIISTQHLPLFLYSMRETRRPIHCLFWLIYYCILNGRIASQTRLYSNIVLWVLCQGGQLHRRHWLMGDETETLRLTTCSLYIE